MFAALVVVALPVAAQEKPAAETKPTQAELEKKFGELLTGSQLVGHYTIWGVNEDKPGKDTYTIEKVTKGEGDKWTFLARIQYGTTDVKVPITLDVKWAGDTPVITLDKLAIPGVGTFSARVVFHGEHYAAVWDGGDHGGHMYGKVVKMKEEKTEEERRK
jgi:hypothetical protein